MSVTLFIKDAVYKRDFSDLANVCMEIEDKAIKSFIAKHGLALDPYSMTYPSNGNIVVHVASMTSTQSAQLADAILTQLDLLGITVGVVSAQKEFLYFPIVNNPNRFEGPPDLNVCEGNKHTVFNLLLGFPVQEYPFDMTVTEVKAALNRQELKLLVPEAGRDTEVEEGNGCTVISCGLSAERIQAYLEQIKAIVDWAETNGFQKLVVD